jgi:hypothetical protein
LLLLIGACPKRQTMKSTIVFVPTKPPAAQPAEQSSKEQAMLVIEEPAPPPEPQPEPEANAPAPATQPPAPRRSSGQAHAKTTTEPDEPVPAEAPDTEPVIVPTIEPRESSAQQTELRSQFDKLETDIQQRLSKLNGAQLSESDHKTVEDAKTFLAQATQAITTGDLPRALNLARKASLLLAALQ